LLEAQAPIGLKDQALLDISAEDKKSLAQDRINNRAFQLYQLEQQMSDKNLNREQKDRLAQQHADLMKELAQMRVDAQLEMKRMGVQMASAIAAGKDKGYKPTTKTSLEDNPIQMSHDGTSYHEVINGVTNPVPYTGKQFDAADKKAIAKVTDSATHINYMEKMLKDVESKEGKELYGWRQGLGETASNAVGGTGMEWATGLTPAQLAKRGEVYYDFAKKMHEIYGSALTAGEIQRAARWTVGSTMEPDVVASRIRGQIAFAKEMEQTHGEKARAAAAARNPGLVSTSGASPAPKAGAAPAAPQGWGNFREKKEPR